MRDYSRRDVLRLCGDCAIIGLSGAMLASCSPNRTPVDIDTWVSPYDWDALLQNHRNHWFYYPSGKLSSRFGIDVSDHDGEIDWAAVKGDGVEFAFLRIGYRGYTEGGLIEDTCFEDNYKGAVKHGIPVGLYMFSSAINEGEAQEEAKFVLEHLNGRQLEYPIVYDQEPVSDPDGRANNLSSEEYSACARAFCEYIEAAGYRAMIYGNQHYLSHIDDDMLDHYPIWYAEYGVDIPTGHFVFTFWQYSNQGEVAGIDTATDLDIMFVVEKDPQEE